MKPLVTDDQLKSAIGQASTGQLEGHSKDEMLSLSHCFFNTCMNFGSDIHGDVSCSECLSIWLRGSAAAQKPIGTYGVAIGYLLGLLEIPLASLDNGMDAYNVAWCGSVNTTGCKVKYNYPGPQTTSILSWEAAAQYLRELPRKQWDGEVWRGPELGFFIEDPYIWSGKETRLDPMGLSLGMLPSQHVVVRPRLIEAFKLGDGVRSSASYVVAQNQIKGMIDDFLASRDTINVADDIKALIFQMYNKLIFDIDVSWSVAQAFVTTQTLAVGLSVLGVALPGFLYALLGQFRDDISNLVSTYIKPVQQRWGAGLDQDACKPTSNCTLQLAAAFSDAFLFAGGLSVPTDIATGIGLFYSNHSSNPFPSAAIPPGKELNFFLENIRLFAPVVGVPSWSKRPTCRGLTCKATQKLMKPNGATEACPPNPLGYDVFMGFPPPNLYKGGKRESPALAIASRDPAKWGQNSNDFVIRTLTEYKNNFIGFADFAEDPSVQGGNMDRSCPGKDLALAIGEQFFKAFNKDEWEVNGSPESITYSSGPTWVSSFKLKRKATN